MKILHLNGFTNEDKLWYRNPIRRNTIQALGQILQACTEMRIVHQNSIHGLIKEFEEFRYTVLKSDLDIEIPEEMAVIISQLWESSGIQMAYQRRWSFSLLDSAKYFLDSISRIASSEYLPDVQDVIQCRYPTIGTEEIEFRYKDMDFSLVDVGGQRTERRKWLNFFDNVQMLLFVAALSDYDLYETEDPSQNRLTANRYIFKTIVQSSFFKNSAIVLFLNKYDTFQEKIVYSPLSRFYPEYKGGHDKEKASEFLGAFFKRHVRDQYKFFMFFTTAVDTRNVDLMFGSAVTYIINQNLRATGSY
ncbi:hypothetical protein FO519_001261 [Halicephalobus sp. NKZ332]|nr:hypothetical protein FO519_001261 [Halicephalobus sp. NKZ332]